MNAILSPSKQTNPSGSKRTDRSAPPQVLHPILIALAAFLGVGSIGLGITLVAGATIVFNILVFALFTALWMAFVAALAFSSETLDDAWRVSLALPLVIQVVVWLLFLPIMIGLWIWRRTWALPVRLLLVLAIGAWNILVFFPRGL